MRVGDEREREPGERVVEREKNERNSEKGREQRDLKEKQNNSVYIN